MDLWNVSKEKIKEVAETKSKFKAIEVNLITGLWTDVKMNDYSFVRVFDYEV